MRAAAFILVVLAWLTACQGSDPDGPQRTYDDARQDMMRALAATESTAGERAAGAASAPKANP